ncbi:MAG: acyloxyacyl hydrolase [Akkermansiaceae bacterium]|nr:acyloxyacyl hydrolase [Verrucomicrobiales bacterium]
MAVRRTRAGCRSAIAAAFAATEMRGLSFYTSGNQLDFTFFAGSVAAHQSTKGLDLFCLNRKFVVAGTRLTVGLAMALAVRSSPAQDWSFASVGVYAGTSFNDRSETFRQMEAVADFNLPWRWQFGTDWQVSTRLELSAGWLHGEDEDAVLGTIGPKAILSWKDFPLTLDVGSSPTLISRHRFGRRDFGIPFQFTTHVGLNWELSRHVSVGYRYAHMSNAGLGSPNPGLNLHLLGISYHF